MLLGLFSWLASKRVASRRVDAPTPKQSHHQGRHHDQHQHQQQYSNQNQFGLRVAKIQGPPQAEALGDKQRRILWIGVKDACMPVPIIIVENRVGAPAISECARLCRGTLRMPEEDEDNGKQQSTHQQEKKPHVHQGSSFQAGSWSKSNDSLW
jgi:hypothetical protein